MAGTRLPYGQGLHKPTPVRDQLERLRRGVVNVADGIGGLEDLIEAQARVLVYDDPDIPPILPVITGTTVLLRLLREELEGLYMQFTDEIKKVEV